MNIRKINLNYYLLIKLLPTLKFNQYTLFQFIITIVTFVIIVIQMPDTSVKAFMGF